MNNDLISRSDLKKAIAEFHQKQKDRLHNHLWDSISVNNLNDLIDNAPTVEYTFEEAFQKTVCEQKLYCPSRSQGKWSIKPKENSQSAILICNKCNHFIPITIDKNYCPNCGAEMKGGAV